MDCRTEVEIDLRSDDKNKDLSCAEKIEIPFIIELEWRSWGLKDVGIYASRIITIPYSETDVETGESVDKEVEVDLGKLESESVRGAYTALSVVLRLKTDGSIDYDKSAIEFGNGESNA